jgi:hypothetical protein
MVLRLKIRTQHSLQQHLLTPLAVAAFWGYADIAEFLLEIE